MTFPPSLRRFLRAAALSAGGALLLLLLLALAVPLPAPKPYSLLIEDRDGRFIQAFLASDGAWRLRTSPSEIPDRLKEILLRREDRWFYYHPGINPFAIARAVFQNVVSGRRVSGASTITMQIARMMEPKERTYGHKLIEMFRALQLELRYSKSQILEMYLSMVPLGGNIEGLKSASLLYYQTPIERLNIAQLFDLILIPGNPNELQPDRNADRLLAERKRQAAVWIDGGLLTPTDSMTIWNTPAGAERHALPRRAPHFALRVREQWPGDADFRSSLDLEKQSTVERLLSSHLRPWKARGVQNGAAIVVRNDTREVIAYAGSENFDDAAASGQVDAVRALRSPGSTLKPLLFAMQMDRGELTPHRRLLDTPYDAEGYLAENYDGTYAGMVSADDALRRSLNVPMVRMLKSAGGSKFVDFAIQAGVHSLALQKSKLGLSVILGGCGVTLEEMVTAYAAFPNGGRTAPLKFRRIGQSDPNEGTRVFSPSSAWMVTEILSDLDRPDLPANMAGSSSLPTIAFKTGTSYGRRDAWSIGYTAEYTVGVWVGNVSQKGIPELVGSKSAAPLLIDILNSISNVHEKNILSCPRDIRAREVCALSGMPPGPQCTRLIEDVYSAERTSSVPCTICKEVMVSPDGLTTYCAACLGDHPAKATTIEDYPPELVDYWEKNGIRKQMPPRHNPECTRLASGTGPTIVSPSENMTYFLSAADPKMALQATSGVMVRSQAWYIDKKFQGRIRAGEKSFFTFGAGKHTVTCVDDLGRTSAVTFTIRVM